MLVKVTFLLASNYPPADLGPAFSAIEHIWYWLGQAENYDFIFKESCE